MSGLDWTTPFHLIDDHLYLGNLFAANSLGDGYLKQLNITHIISVLSSKVTFQKHRLISYHFIDAEDYAGVDLLSHFAETNQLIECCEKSKQNILIHCMVGVSRSATIVIAYIMHKYKMSFSSAKSLVKSKRNIVNPNKGFAEQLILFEKMNFCLNVNDRRFRQHLIKSYFSFGNDSSSVDKYFERLSVVETFTPILDLGQSYSCSKCGHKLFHQLNVIRNEELTEPSGQSCQTVYVEPQKWMTELFHFDQSILANDYQFIKCFNCSESIAKFEKNFDRFECNCWEHKNNKFLKIQMLDKSFTN